MTEINIIYPVIQHLFTAILLLFFWNRIKAQYWISAVSMFIALATAAFLFYDVFTKGILTMQAGNWPAPFGIIFVADNLSATLVLLSSIVGFAIAVFSLGSIGNTRVKFGYFPILHFLLMGINGAFLTGDIFNLYVWFEIIIISSFVLITLGGDKPQLEGAVKYVTMNLLASVIFLSATGILYGLVGSLNMADLSLKVAAVENRSLVQVTAMLFFIGFGIKSAVFPLYFWLPASYHTPPSAISSIFAGLLTKVGVYALIRVFTLIFIPDEFMLQVILWVAGLTLLSGALGAILQKNIRKILSYLIVCHIGYMIAGLGMFTVIALTGAIFYLIHDIIIKTNLFMISGIIQRIQGTYNITKSGGLYSRFPLLSLLMAVSFFSLIGVPPLSGFWPKINLIKAGFSSGSWIIIFFILFASFITLYVIAKVWGEVFWKDKPEMPVRKNFIYFHQMKKNNRRYMVAPVIFLSAVTLYIGIGAEHIFILSERIAAQLMDSTPYINAVLGIDYQKPGAP